MVPESNSKRQFSLRSLLFGLALISVCLAAIGCLFQLQATQREVLRRNAKEELRIAALDKISIAAIVKDVESLRTELGRAPKDVAEVEQLLAKPMPVVHQGPLKSPIHYTRTGEDSFVLSYEFSSSGNWQYMSDYPAHGWKKMFN